MENLSSLLSSRRIPGEQLSKKMEVNQLDCEIHAEPTVEQVCLCGRPGRYGGPCGQTNDNVVTLLQSGIRGCQTWHQCGASGSTCRIYKQNKMEIKAFILRIHL